VVAVWRSDHLDEAVAAKDMVAWQHAHGGMLVVVWTPAYILVSVGLDGRIQERGCLRTEKSLLCRNNGVLTEDAFVVVELVIFSCWNDVLCEKRLLRDTQQLSKHSCSRF
jgi:hypothetical protein